MLTRTSVLVGLVVLLVAASSVAQTGRRQATFPAQQREAADPELVARGRALYDLSCRACHGVDLRGGDLGGPNLLRSQLVLADQAGENIWPVLRDGQSTAGGDAMPPQSLSEEDAGAVVAFIHSVLATAQRQGAPPPGGEVELDVLVGDPEAGRAYFAGACAACHSAEGDLAGLATRIPDPKTLQNTWVRGGARGTAPPPVTVTVTRSSGERVRGRLERLDDFHVALVDGTGRRRSFSRRGTEPRVEVDDPLERHRALLSVYSDSDIHDVTAFLATLR